MSRLLTNSLNFILKNSTIFCFLILTLFSCYKLEENDKRYSARKLQKMLEGTWEVVDYQIDGVSYLDTLLKINKRWNCETYTFVQWKNTSENKGDKYLETGNIIGNCINPIAGWGYSFSPKNKTIQLGGGYFIDSIYFYEFEPIFLVTKLENNTMVLEESNDKSRKIYFKKL